MVAGEEGRSAAGSLLAAPPQVCRRAQAAVRRSAELSRRAVLARRLARLLLPAAERAGGFTSTQLRVRPDGAAPARAPDVVLVLGAPPVDGLLQSAPAVACFLDPDTPGAAIRPLWWLGLGTLAVWQLDGAALRIWTPERTEIVRAPAAAELRLPGAEAPTRLAVDQLVAGR